MLYLILPNNRRRQAFTLVELIVVIALIALLIGLLLPGLAGSRNAGRRIVCLTNLRSIETAHWAYILENDGWLLSTTHAGPDQSWMNVLQSYDESLVLRSPADVSPHFDEPINGRYRRTSYSINRYLSPDSAKGVGRLDRVISPSAIVHSSVGAFEGPGAVVEHMHPWLWWSHRKERIPGTAATEIQINAHGGEPASWASRSNYGFLDCHAASDVFSGIYQDDEWNRLDPNIAR